MIRHLKLTAIGFTDLLVESFYSASEKGTEQAELRSRRQLAKSKQLLFGVVVLSGALLVLPALLAPSIPGLAHALGSSISPRAMALSAAALTFTILILQGSRFLRWAASGVVRAHSRGLELESGTRKSAWGRQRN